MLVQSELSGEPPFLCCHLVRLRLVFAGGELYSQWGFENVDKETDDGVNMDG